MGGSESEAVFKSLNLNPQLFINETLNTIGDLVDEAFDFYRQEAPIRLKIEGNDRSKDLSDGIGCIHCMVQSVLDKRLQMWEQYSLCRCFAVPKGFSLPQHNESADDDTIGVEAVYDLDLDSQLDSLREKLNLVGKKSAELNAELRALERQSVSGDLSAGLVKEALQLYDQSCVHNMFKEMVKTASELRRKMAELKTRRMEGVELVKREKFENPIEEFSLKSNGLSSAKLEVLQEFLSELKKN